MKKFIILLIFILLCSCASTKNYNEKKGLMLLETSQLSRNKGYYSKHHIKTINKNYKKLKNKYK